MSAAACKINNHKSTVMILDNPQYVYRCLFGGGTQVGTTVSMYIGPASCMAGVFSTIVLVEEECYVKTTMVDGGGIDGGADVVATVSFA